jgi:hypothetical protein
MVIRNCLIPLACLRQNYGDVRKKEEGLIWFLSVGQHQSHPGDLSVEMHQHQHHWIKNQFTPSMAYKFKRIR